MAMRMRRAVGDAEAMGEGGAKAAEAAAASCGDREEAKEADAEEELSVSPFLGVTIASLLLSETEEEDDSSAFFFTGVDEAEEEAVTVLCLPDGEVRTEEEPVNVETGIAAGLLMALTFSAPRPPLALSFCWRGEADLPELLVGMRSAARSRIRAALVSPSLATWGDGRGFSAPTGCLVASIHAASSAL
jgi:hypothetical protein